MNLSQAPWWMSLATAVVALSGVLVGIFVNGWREKRSWKLELEREEVRWQRQQQEEAAKREHASLLDWRGRKLELYAELLGAFKDCEYAADMDSDSVVIENGKAYYAAHDFKARLAEPNKRFRTVAQQVELVASSELRAQILIPPRDNSVTFEVSSTLLVSREEVSRFVKTVRHNREKVLKVMRKELGTSDNSIYSQMFGE